MTKQIEVKILGRDFTISCPENEEENLQKSISYLKHKVDEIQQSGSTIGVDKTIIKAALDITHEFLNQGDNKDLHTLDYQNKQQSIGYISESGSAINTSQSVESVDITGYFDNQG